MLMPWNAMASGERGGGFAVEGERQRRERVSFGAICAPTVLTMLVS
jgi:hypothetical protein